MQVIQAALKGLQCCLSGVKWKFGGGEELGSILASLKVQNCNTFAISLFFFFFFVEHYMTVYTVHFLQRLMFQGTPGVSVEWPAVLYPAPLPQYEGQTALKPAEPQKPSEKPKDAAAPGKTSGVSSSKDCFKISDETKAVG